MGCELSFFNLKFILNQLILNHFNFKSWLDLFWTQSRKRCKIKSYLMVVNNTYWFSVVSTTCAILERKVFIPNIFLSSLGSTVNQLIWSLYPNKHWNWCMNAWNGRVLDTWSTSSLHAIMYCNMIMSLVFSFFECSWRKTSVSPPQEKEQKFKIFTCYLKFIQT